MSVSSDDSDEVRRPRERYLRENSSQDGEKVDVGILRELVCGRLRIMDNE